MKTPLPIDDWAKEKHPEFLRNIQAHISILCEEKTAEDRYAIVRGIMQYTRQEFEPRIIKNEEPRCAAHPARDCHLSYCSCPNSNQIGCTCPK